MPPGAAPEPLDRLIVRAGLALQRRTRKAAAAQGLSATAVEVLGALVEHDGVSHRDLAGHVRLAPATLTPVLDALEEDGVLTRVRDGADRRVVRVSLTVRGQQWHDAAVREVRRAIGELPQASAADIAIIRAHLLDLLEAVDPVEAPPAGH